MMYQWLNNLYLNPHKQSYRALSSLHKNYKMILITLILVIAIYPIIRSIYYIHQTHLQQKALSSLHTTNANQEIILKNLIKNRKNNEHEPKLTEINYKIKELIENKHIHIESIQWTFDKGKQIHLVLNQQSKPIFDLIYDLDQVEHLYFNHLILSKLNQHKLIQLQADLIFE